MLKVLIDVLMMNVCYYSGWVFVGMTYGDMKHMGEKEQEGNFLL